MKTCYSNATVMWAEAEKRASGSLERMVSTPFWQRGLDTLQQIAREPIAPADELRMLQQQLESAIGMVERGGLVPMSEHERIEHASRFGVGAFVIGDFVITRRRSANDGTEPLPLGAGMADKTIL